MERIVPGWTLPEWTPPEWTLPQRMYLLTYDLEKTRLDPRSTHFRGPVIRAAAVAELAAVGLLRDLDGKAVRDTSVPAPDDPFLAEVLAGAAPDKPLHWMTLVDDRRYRAEAVVREQLEAQGVIATEKRRLLGLLPDRRITVKNLRQVAALRDTVRATALLDRNPATLPIEDVALVVIAAEANVHSVFTSGERRERKKAFAVLADHLDRALPGFRRGVQLAIASRQGALTS